MKEEVLRFRSLMKAANEGKLFSDIEMQVCKGEIIGLRSDNNGIAQALLRIIAGTDRPNSGSVYIDGARYAFDDAATLLRNVVYTFDHVEEFSPELSVLDVFTVAGGAIDKDFHESRDEAGKRTLNHLEVDFVCNKGSKRYYLQSAFSIPDEKKRIQEKNSLIHVKDMFKKIIVVRDNIKLWRDEDGIVTMGIMEFLLNSESLDL